MTSSKPYLIRAIYQWITENSMAPYLLVDATQEGVFVPDDFVRDGRIVLNVNPGATINLELGNDTVSFNARFAGIATDVMLPVSSVLAIYARETGKGMIFDESDNGGNDLPPLPTSPTGDDDGPKKAMRPNLKIVK